MARLRTLKPGFFTNDLLGEMDPLGRLLFAGLWTSADREGRLEDRPRKIKAEVLPYDSADVDTLLTELMGKGFIVRYEADGARYIQIVNWNKHQQPHYKEAGSIIPPPPGHVDSDVVTFAVPTEQRRRIMERDGHRCVECGSAERLTIDHILARSKGGGGEDDNLRVLCLPCNSAKNNREAKATSDRSRTEVVSSSPSVSVLVDRSLGSSSGNQEQSLAAARPVRAVPKPRTLQGDDASRFERWYAVYPKHEKRPEAERAWSKLLPDDALTARLIADVEARQGGRKWAEGYVEQPATYLNQQVWQDDIEPLRPARAGPAGNGTATTFDPARYRQLADQHRELAAKGDKR